MLADAIEAEFRKWFVGNAGLFKGRTLHVCFSGNFTIEQLVGPVGSAIHSNNVTAYTHFVGHFLARNEFRWAVKGEQWQWLVPYFERNPAAAMVMLFEFLKWNEKNAYNRRVRDAWMAGWKQGFAETCASVEAAREVCKLTSYRSSDVFAFVDEAAALDPDGVFVLQAATKGGFKGLLRYSGVHVKLAEIVDWDRPHHEPLTPVRKQALIERLNEFSYVVIDDQEEQGRSELVLKQKRGPNSARIYTNLEGPKSLLVRGHKKSEATNYPEITAAEIDLISPASTVVINRVPGAIINYYRNRFLAKTINFSDGMWNFLLFVDGKLFGFAIMEPRRFSTEGVYLLSDFAVPAAKDSRLAKLVLTILQSTHLRGIVEDIMLTRVPLIATTAFTDMPVSQKYRSAGWTLERRGVDGDGKKFLNYQTATGLHDDKGAIEKWLKLKEKGERARAKASRTSSPNLTN